MRNIKQMLSLSPQRNLKENLWSRLTRRPSSHSWGRHNNANPQKSYCRRLAAHGGERSAYWGTIRRHPPRFFKDVLEHLAQKMNIWASSILRMSGGGNITALTGWRVGNCKTQILRQNLDPCTLTVGVPANVQWS